MQLMVSEEAVAVVVVIVVDGGGKLLHHDADVVERLMTLHHSVDVG